MKKRMDFRLLVLMLVGFSIVAGQAVGENTMLNGQLVLCDPHYGIEVAPLNRVNEAKTPFYVKISDFNEHFAAYREGYPEAQVQEYMFDGQGFSDILNKLITKDSSLPNVLSWPPHGFYYGPLKEKGYLMDLSGSEKIVEQTAKYYPFIQEALTRNGEGIYAVPTYFHHVSWSFLAREWEAEMDIPNEPGGGYHLPGGRDVM